jgi:hypothetical protein
MWTAEAVKAGKVHRIRSMEEQKTLIKQNLLTSADINPPGSGNPYVGGRGRPRRSSIVLLSRSRIFRPNDPARREGGDRVKIALSGLILLGSISLADAQAIEGVYVS